MRFLLTKGISIISKADNMFHLWGSHISTVQALKYMQKSCFDTFTSCYTRNSNIKAKLKTSKKWVAVTSPDYLFKHRIDFDYKQMDCGKILKIYSNSITKVLPSVNSEIKHSMQATTYIWTANCQNQNAYISLLIFGMLFLFWINGCWCSNAKLVLPT